MDQAMSLPCSACAAVGCALPSSHSSAAECRLSATRAPLWAACCHPIIPNVVDPQCVRRCGLRIAFVASACPRTSLTRSVCAAVGCALPSMHPNAQEFRRVRTPKKFCSASAAVGYALVSLHPNAEEHFDDLAAFARKKRLLANTTEKEGIRAGDCFFSIGQRVLIGLGFFHRVETSAPGLSGYYWYHMYDISHWNSIPLRSSSSFWCRSFESGTLRTASKALADPAMASTCWDWATPNCQTCQPHPAFQHHNSQHTLLINFTRLFTSLSSLLLCPSSDLPYFHAISCCCWTALGIARCIAIFPHTWFQHAAVFSIHDLSRRHSSYSTLLQGLECTQLICANSPGLGLPTINHDINSRNRMHI